MFRVSALETSPTSPFKDRLVEDSSVLRVPGLHASDSGWG